MKMTMFLSKAQNASRLFQIFPRVQYTEGILGLFPCRKFSDNVPSSDKAVPDKLYKKIEIEIRGNDPEVLKSYGIFSSMAAKHLGIVMSRNFTPKKPVHQRLTVLKSVHIYKKHRVQYETRTYFRFLDFLKLTGSTADTFLEYLQRNLPEGVAMKVTKVEIQRLPEAVCAPPS